MKEYKRVYRHHKSGGFVDVSARAYSEDLLQNIAYGKIFARQGHKVKILAHSDEQGVKNPEVSIDGKIGDFKTPRADSHNSLQTQIKRAAKQNAEFAAIFLKGRKYNASDMKRAIYGALGNKDWNKSVKFIYLIYPYNKIIKITRKEVANLRFITKLKPL